MIYFITARDIDRVKIGYAADPKLRLKQLQAQTACPAKLTLEATLEGGRVLEAELHQVFRSFRVRGEWFNLDPAIEMAIHHIRAGCPEVDDVHGSLWPFIVDRNPILQKMRVTPDALGWGSDVPAQPHSGASA